MANEFFDKFHLKVWTGVINPSTAVFRVMAEEQASTYVYDATDEFVSDLTGFVEVAAAGYARQSLANVQVQYDAGNRRIELTADANTWSAIASGERIDRFIIYVQTGGNDASPNNDPLVGIIDTLGSVSLPLLTNGGSVVITWNAEGVFQVYQG